MQRAEDGRSTSVCAQETSTISVQRIQASYEGQGQSRDRIGGLPNHVLGRQTKEFVELTFPALQSLFFG